RPIDDDDDIKSPPVQGLVTDRLETLRDPSRTLIARHDERHDGVNAACGYHCSGPVAGCHLHAALSPNRGVLSLGSLQSDVQVGNFAVGAIGTDKSRLWGPKVTANGRPRARSRLSLPSASS